MPILNMVGGGKKGGGNIGEPLNLTVTSAGTDATITWEDNEIGTIPPTTFQKSELVRKVGSAPTSPSDGTLVVTETVKDTYKVSGYVDSGLTVGTTYYYRVFSYSDLGGISYCDAQSVTITNERQPGADTVAYWKFDGDLTDETGNYDISNYGSPTVSYEALPGNSNIQCVKLTTGEGSDTIRPSADIWLERGTAQTDLSMGVWVKYGTLNNYQDFMYSSGTTGWAVTAFVYMDNDDGVTQSICLATGSGGWQRNPVSWTPSTGTWYHVFVTYDHTTRTKSYYVNGTLIGTATASNDYVTSTTPNFTIVGRKFNNSCLSRFILEKDKVWTSQEVSDYFDGTKADYGIS